jgi:hypothetical protein
VGHQHRSGEGEEQPGHAVVDALAADPHAAAVEVEAEQAVTVSPWLGRYRAVPHNPISADERVVLTRAFALSACLLALALAGCGSDKEKSQASAPSTTTAPTATAPSATAPPTGATGEKPTTTITSPEKQPGGAGDEEPARAPAELTGRGGRISPRLVRVPPFIAIAIELRSGDGREYALRFDGKTLRASGAVRAARLTHDGLRPGARLVGRPLGAGNAVTIEASAEPGP